MPEPLPPMDDILRAGRARQKRLELVIGLILVGGGLAFRLGTHEFGGGATYAIYGALGIGVGLILDGLFGAGRGDRLDRLDRR